ncbi:MAG: DNA polymerase III subunit gamma/tau [Patescibacteria group bacterium]
MTYYLKYRSQTIAELDIATVRETLTNIVKSGSIPHAFLFAGPKGTGKTSAARILAKVINCESSKEKPCNKCSQCISITNGTNIDVIEMDAASNRGIDDVRALRDIVKLAPANAKAKIYIIDEAHMLTIEASNALLKTLEEPPSHVYFILATTNPEKLIETIKSRTTSISFTKATDEEIFRSLKRVVKGEKIEITNDDLNKIIKISKGSFRDAVKNLEQYSSDKSFLIKDLNIDLEVFVEALIKKDIKIILADLKKANNIHYLTSEILNILHQKLVNSESLELIPLIELILKSNEMIKVSPIEKLPLEIAIIKWCNL